MRKALISLFLFCCFLSAEGAEIINKAPLSLRGKVVTEQFADVRDQRCFETLQGCQNSLSKLALSFRPSTEKEAALTLQVEQLKVQVEQLKAQNAHYLRTIGCLRLTGKDQDTCLKSVVNNQSNP